MAVAALVAATFAVVTTQVASPPPAAADPPVAGIAQIAPGFYHSCALRANGTVKCYGNGDYIGQGSPYGVGASGNLPVVDLGPGRTATDLVASYGHTCATLDDGSLKCWGKNASGQLGLGDTGTRGDAPGEMGDALPAVDLGTGRAATQVALAGDVGSGGHSCAVLDNGQVKCWGYSNYGALGLGTSGQAYGDQTGEMGDALPAVDLGTGRTATAITADLLHTCALLDNGQVKCWGYGSLLGIGISSGEYRGDGPGEMGDNLPPVDLGTGRTATAVTNGDGHTCALLDNDEVKCWGSNHAGQLGLGDTETRGDGPGEMGDNLPAVDLGTGRTAVAIDANGAATCALLDNGELKCWGDNNRGKLGLGNTTNRGDGPGEMGDNLPAVDLPTGRTAVAVERGGHHTCAVLDDHTVVCWGYGFHGQLGAGGSDVGDGPGEMGDALARTRLDKPPTIAVTADEATVAVGDPLHLHVTVTNPGDGTLAGLVVDGGTATACDTTVATLAPGAQQVLDCTHVAEAADLSTFSTTVTATNPHTSPATSSSLSRPVTVGGGLGGVAGSVTRSGGFPAVAGALVALLHPADFSLVGSTVARPDGRFGFAATPGDYFLYALDPSGNHLPGFASPALVTLTAGTTTASGAQLARVDGSISGTVREDSTGTRLANVLVATLATTTGQPGAGGLTGADGSYVAEPLTGASRYLILADLSGAHAPEFWNNQPSIATASPVTVGATWADAYLAPATPPTGGAIVAGTVTEEGTGDPVAEVAVIALRATDMGLAAGAVTNGSGEYSLDLDPGDYKLEFYPTRGAHAMEWHDDLPYDGIAGAVTVTAAAGTPTTVDADLDPAFGAAAGAVTEQGTGAPLEGIWVVAIGPTGSVRADLTDPAGAYQLTGLPPGDYRLRFVDPTGAHDSEYFDDSTGPDTAATRTVTVAQTTVTDAALTPTP